MARIIIVTPRVFRIRTSFIDFNKHTVIVVKTIFFSYFLFNHYKVRVIRIPNNSLCIQIINSVLCIKITMVCLRFFESCVTACLQGDVQWVEWKNIINRRQKNIISDIYKHILYYSTVQSRKKYDKIIAEWKTEYCMQKIEKFYWREELEEGTLILLIESRVYPTQGEQIYFLCDSTIIRILYAIYTAYV